MIADMHCHVDLYSDPIEVAQEAAKNNIWVLAVTTTPKAWTGTKQRLRQFQNVEVALGLHPELAHLRHAEIPLWESLLQQSRFVGEIGLDGSPEYRQYAETQLAVFKRILHKCRTAAGRVLTIHSRRAASEVLEALKETPGCGLPILHWFSGTKLELDAAIRFNCWFSVGPAMLRAASGAQRVRAMPRNRVVLETDGPFGKYRNRALCPADVGDAITLLAGIWRANPDEVQRQVEVNQGEIWRSAGYEIRRVP